VTLSERSTEKEHIDWSLGTIGQQIRHLTRIIDDLLDVSRITLGKIELRKILVDVVPIVTSAVEVVRPLIQARRHELSLFFSADSLWLEADATRIEQVLINLLNNAVKYTEDGGHIWIQAEHAGDQVVITIRDNGIGIPPEKLPEMFELFVQEDRSLTRSEGGLGIGLTLVRSLVGMHGGSVMASSDGRGKGSTFTVRLPASPQAKPAPALSRPAPAAREPAAQAARIIIVDDSRDTAYALSRLLKHLGHQVEIAYDGPTAIEAARRFNPRFVLLDIGLPGMDGYEVAAQLRKEDCGRDAVIIAISGYGQESDRRRSREAGFDHHLVKPMSINDLISLISQAPSHPPADGR
jgi:CheY-like chemotaxis protein